MTLFLVSRLITNLQMIGLGSARRVTKRDSVSDIDVVNSNVSAHAFEQINAKITGLEASSLTFSSETPRILMLKA